MTVMGKVIKVEPYWNVKIGLSAMSATSCLIKVEPYWNAKEARITGQMSTRQIKVEPYWNVKMWAWGEWLDLHGLE